MCFRCFIVPEHVLRKLAEDKALSDQMRSDCADTARLDVELRKLRKQKVKLTRVAALVGSPRPTIVAAAPAVSVFDCKTSQVLPGSPVPDPMTAPDETAKRVFAETTSLSTFFSTVFGRNSIDDAGMTMLSSIHYGINYNNAFWDGTQMTYGDGDGSLFVDFSKGNDVIGHELTHGVTQHTLSLNYTNEAGGLNESISDCFGSMFRQWEAKQSFERADWKIGADVMGAQARTMGYTCLRDMASPAGKHCLGPQITQYKQFTTGMDPHTSSGVANLAFYAICKAVGGYSWEKVGQIWYKVMTTSGPKPSMNMKAFANQTRAVAAQLYAGDVKIAGAVDAGWKSVGL